MNDRSTLLLEHHLKELKLPSFLRECGKMAALCAAENADHPEYPLRPFPQYYNNSPGGPDMRAECSASTFILVAARESPCTQVVLGKDSHTGKGR